MHSEFYHVALDRLRYSLVWEDSSTLYDTLRLTPTDRVLLISSAGCNVLNALLKDPQAVVAVDINPVQNELLRLKTHLIAQHSPATLQGLLGFDGPEAVRQAFGEASRTLTDSQRAYWQPVIDSNPNGLLTAGKLETYLTAFLPTLDTDTQAKLRQLITFTNVPDQWQFFSNELNDSFFKEQFIDYFDDANLSKGRDPRLFQHAQEPGGVAFYNRLCRQLQAVVVGHNFFFRFLFFGPHGIPESLWPPGYQAKHHAQLRANLNRLDIIDSEAITYLSSEKGRSITKASLSNIFEYTSRAEFERVCDQLQVRRPLRLVYWNLLQEQRLAPGNPHWQEQTPPPLPTACFYFRSVHVLATR